MICKSHIEPQRTHIILRIEKIFRFLSIKALSVRIDFKNYCKANRDLSFLNFSVVRIS